MNNQILGFIGGSGLYDIDFIKNKKAISIRSSFGKPSDKIIEGKIGNQKVYFLSRHGRGHKLSPQEINYRANIECLKKCNVTDLISLSAVGSLKEKLSPGTFVIVDQFIDKTQLREKTFFKDGIVAHVPMAKPTSKILMKLSLKVLKELNIRNQYMGTYVAIEGPQFSTRSESLLYKSWNADVIGMTNMPEAKLAREAEMRYCSISMVTDYDCWHDNFESVDVEMLLKNLKNNSENALNFIKKFTYLYSKGIDFGADNTSSILNNSIVTQKKYWKKDTRKKLKTILERYNKDNK
ncbi:MAG: S-methyl-5'-thioadenosine phosphorylase [Alphaproteobacteria bacterium MarineAlpha5_Bin12]|nr:5'-methylthioadenosine phosphorylase [Pelagibacteraceae bacterium]MBG76255.1 5'-methylthioadenosine phosphorylase [Pelagibacteraceae bacterium]PPR42058.1 MAG: S-methyl-5'-thioadenosine phosphorylase [Alphaproteobacteria bacterium MarineAlpha5_Bin12]|tara:strand:+ start:7925 stop:8806 length:882 start_codon:yes stop_codon:yes gene_type:complete